MCTHHIKGEKVMSRFFSKDMNIQNYAQTEAEAVSRHRLSQPQKDKSTDFDLSASFTSPEIQIIFKRHYLLFLNTHRWFQ